MSVHFTGPVWRLDLPTVPKIVLLKFGDNANDDGYTWPAIDRVARECGLSARSVQRHVATMRADGVLVPMKGANGGRRKGHENGETTGNTCRYWIDLERAKDLYRRHGTGYGGGGASSGPTDADNGLEENDETELSTAKGDTESPLGAKGDSGDVKGDSDDIKGDSDDIASIEEPSTEPSTEPARARDPSPDGGEGSRSLEPTGPPPACGVWREAEDRLKAVPAWGLLCRAIPDADDGEVLTLAVEAPWVGYAILAWACGGPFGAAALLHRRIECRVRRWVQAALAARGQFTLGKPSLAAHRRNGETVRLSDAPWAAWAAARAEHPECAWLDCALPDDLEEGALIVRVGDARHMTQLLDGAVESLAAAVGGAVRPRYGGDMDAALKAQREGDPLRVVAADGDRSSSDLIRGPRVGTG